MFALDALDGRAEGSTSPATATAVRKTRPKNHLPGWFVAVVIACALGVFALMCATKSGLIGSSTPPAATEPAAMPAAPAEAQPPPKPEPTIAEKVAAWETLPIAILNTKAAMRDTMNEHNEATLLLTLWSAQKLTRDALMMLPKTTRGLVMKDAEAEHGKLLCVSGRVSQINADRSSGYTIYEGGIMSGYVDVTRFIAVGETGSIVEDSRARFCGVVTGRYSYSNTGGGTTIAPMLVGMFELPRSQ